MLLLMVTIALCYLIGAIPSAYLAGKWVKGIDIRQHGSGNVGASNVFRVVGKKWGILVLAADVSKGWLATAAVAPFFHGLDPVFPPLLYALIAGIAAVAGHNWTLFLQFKGGKGVATSLGVGLGLLPKAALSALAVWVAVLIPLGYISISSISAALSFPFWVWFYYRHLPSMNYVLPISVGLAILIVYMHRSNIARLRQGTEKKVLGK